MVWLRSWEGGGAWCRGICELAFWGGVCGAKLSLSLTLPGVAGGEGSASGTGSMGSTAGTLALEVIGAMSILPKKEV